MADTPLQALAKNLAATAKSLTDTAGTLKTMQLTVAQKIVAARIASYAKSLTPDVQILTQLAGPTHPPAPIPVPPAPVPAPPPLAIEWMTPAASPTEVGLKQIATWRGSELVNVEVYVDGQIVARANCAPDRKTASVALDLAPYLGTDKLIVAKAWDALPGQAGPATQYKEAAITLRVRQQPVPPAPPAPEPPAPAQIVPACGLTGYSLDFDWTFGPNGKFRDVAALRQMFESAFPWGRINGEFQRYTDFDPKNVHIIDDELHIVATATRGIGFDQIDSGMLISKAPWEIPAQGIVEWCYRPPKGLGMFPAGWLYPVLPTDASEIDGFEHTNNSPDGSRDTTKKIFVNDHFGSADTKVVETGSKLAGWGAYIPGFDFADDFHTAAVQFDGDAKTRWVDKTAVITRTWKWTGPAPRVVVNLACGADPKVNDWPGQPNQQSFAEGANVLRVKSIRGWRK
jgi:hypothetical protein